MRHHNSVFHQMAKFIARDVLEASAAAHGADFRVRRLRTRDRFLALLFGQLPGPVALRATEDGFASSATRLCHGITPAKALNVEPGATHVFDLADYDYGWRADLEARGCRFVTRLKSNSALPSRLNSRSHQHRLGAHRPSAKTARQITPKPLRRPGAGNHRAHQHRQTDQAGEQ